MPVERLGRDGFEPLSSRPEPFNEDTSHDDLDDNVIFYDRADVTFYSLSQRRRFALPLPSPGPVYGIGTAYASVGGHSVSAFGVALADRMAIYNEQGALVASLPYHQDVSRWGALSLGMKGNMEGFYLQYAPSDSLPKPTRDGMPTYYEELNAQGELLHSYSMPPAPPNWRSRSWSEYAVRRLQSPLFFFGGMAYQKVGALLGSKRLADQLAPRFGRDWDSTKEYIVFVLLISLALAAGTWFWARRAGFSTRRAQAWALFVFAGGLAGFIVFRATADWPQFVACAGCRRARPTDDEQCPHCGADWPATPALGTEIFDRDGLGTLAGARS